MRQRVRARHTVHAIAAYLVGALIAALALAFILPVPPNGMSHFSNFGQLVALSLIGPILFVWAGGPAPLGLLGLVAAAAIPVASIGILLSGFVRRKSYLALIVAAAIWSVFGGFFVFVAVTGSI